MPEVIIKYKNSKVLKALRDLTKSLDIVIEQPLMDNLPNVGEQLPDIPITFAKNPNVTALAGIWQGRNVTLQELRKEAWGGRL